MKSNLENNKLKNKPIKRLGIVAHPDRPSNRETIIYLISLLQEKGKEIFVSNLLKPFNNVIVDYCPPDDLWRYSDLILAVGGDEVTDSGVVRKCPVKAGDIVVYKKWGGNEVKVGDKEYLFAKYEDILAIEA